MISTTSRCPSCQAREIVRSRRRPIDLLISRFGFFPFRCMECNTRSHHFAPGGKLPRAHVARVLTK
jgi:hypothetical protein